MTNTIKLREKISESGYKLTFLAAKCGLSYQGFLNKLRNNSEFTAGELIVLKNYLALSEDEFFEIFLAS